MSIFSSWMFHHADVPEHKFSVDDILKAVNLVNNVQQHEWTAEDTAFIEEIGDLDHKQVIKSLIGEVETLRSLVASIVPKG